MPEYRKCAKQLETGKENNNIYLHQKFDDFEQVKEAAAQWSLDFKQLDSGNFKGELMLLDLNDLQLLSAKFNRHIDQQGITPLGYRTFSIPADNKQSFKWRGLDVSSNSLMIFPKSGELDAITYSGFNILTISIADKIVEEFIGSLDVNIPNLLDNKTEVVELSSHTANVLRHQFKYLISQVNQHPDIIHSKAFQKIFTDEVPTLLLNNLIYHKSTPRLPGKRIRDISLKKAIEYLKECKGDMPSVRELCLIGGASQRTLEYAFKDKYGIGPKDYMKKQSLNLVRKALVKADPSSIQIMDIAHQFGFWHLGQFGADYKKLFRELPSNTILRGY